MEVWQCVDWPANSRDVLHHHQEKIIEPFKYSLQKRNDKNIALAPNKQREIKHKHKEFDRITGCIAKTSADLRLANRYNRVGHDIKFTDNLPIKLHYQPVDDESEVMTIEDAPDDAPEAKYACGSSSRLFMYLSNLLHLAAGCPRLFGVRP
ncbi:hypothetical protein LTR56_006210 [Elasticomyces elasticus]|nr:hypothetical protein LTR56_006210 [Elasticomyces elasticus]KAK3666581.1 hypothetical protein LTR22_002525 [Elasticomyces elasticus]KAK4928286.1 hypothetical protein LTR49_004963 [Elasticomyces elasticus]KAK5763849.1 hypothetical protein LTS12_005967 [Elasticomyces elasticus]